MKNFCIAAAVLALSSAVLEAANVEKRNVKFVLHNDVESAMIQGNFGKAGKLIAVPMLKADVGFYINMKLEPGLYKYRFFIGEGKYVTDRFNGESAEEDGIKYSCLRVLPERARDFLAVGRRFMEENESKMAIDTLIQGIKKFPDEVSLYFALGEVYEKVGWLGFAQDCYLSYLERNPTNAAMMRKMAECLEKLFVDTKNNKYRKESRGYWKKLIGTKYEKGLKE